MRGAVADRRSEAVAEAAALMEGFARRTGIDGGRPPRRYLWTDAFAVCNLLALARATGERHHRDLALKLVDQVHQVLGRHRPDDSRRGWISGLDEETGAEHPTRGGLRIGKPLPERPRGAPFDERLEWERDGQYYHYLTRWMYALDRVARDTGEARFNLWARELADAAHRAFAARRRGGGLHMVWKMSIDLSRPLVPSMGQHDPLDGLVTCTQLRATAVRLGDGSPDLAGALADFAALASGRDWATPDPLGLGGLLIDACRIVQLEGEGAVLPVARLGEVLLDAARRGLSLYERGGELARPADGRLAFRELGLAIGLSGLAVVERAIDGVRGTEPLRERVEALQRHRRLGEVIASFWRRPEHRDTRVWAEHRDIDEVMLATCLVPEGVLVLGPSG